MKTIICKICNNPFKTDQDETIDDFDMCGSCIEEWAKQIDER